ncbi:ATP-binding protein [Leptolyngbya boryana]|uniref:ATP-binding protein n=1 Tax=Leptolyngbya boryana TaxID=1184 RepID=UPI000380261C|nr:ATP-binding protein [Leptolyngbya boryana]
MSDRDPSSTTLDTQEFARLSQLSQLRAIWQEQQSSRAEGGLLAISGFEHQFLLALLKVVRCWKELPEAERQDLQQSQRVLTEALSDIVEIGVVVTLTQVKRTLSETMLRSALEELWEIFKLASEHIPNLLDHLRFVISGKFEGERSAEEVIQGWGTKSQNKQKPELTNFKSKVSCELVTDPRAELNNELEELCRDEDAGTTIARWLGYLLQLGSGFPPERISSFIWRELANDQGLAAFSATLARLLSQSQKRLHALRGTLGQSIALSRTELSQLQECVFSQHITLLSGPSGSGKSVLCKLAIQQCFQNFDCLFLNPADIVAFSEASDVIAGRGLRRLDELLAARVIENPILIIDDLSDVDEQSLNTVLDLIHTSLNLHTNSHIRFVLVSHPSGADRIREKLSAQFGTDLSLPVIELPQLPIQVLKLTENLPVGLADLIQRHNEFGPALNLKLLDWLIRSVQEKQVDVSKFKSDLDLLNWFWRDHIGGDRNFNESCRALIKVAEELANRFTPDLPLYFDSSIGSDVLSTLTRKDCLRVVDERVTVSHRFVGDCARFHSLRSNRREIETNNLVEKLMNPLWSQPVRWFALQVVLESENHETWQETVCEALEGEYLQLLDSFLDGAILSTQPGVVLGECPSEHLPLIIERFIIRLLAIATTPFHYEADDSQPTSLRTKLAVQDQVTGTPKPQLWEPAWRWLLSQNPDDILEESCIIFKAAQAWLNWSTDARRFPLRTEVAEFILNLAQRVLLPDPDPTARTISSAELAELIKLRQQGVLPAPELSRRKNYYLGDFKSNAFACIVFTLRIIPERSTWLLRALAGREIIPANRLESTETSCFLSRPGIGVLEPSHPKGPAGEVNHEFREFMLNRNGFHLTTVILVNSQLGAELLLALTIQSPRYRYENDWDDDWRDHGLGTEGSHDLDVCTFDFAPLLTLLELLGNKL